MSISIAIERFGLSNLARRLGLSPQRLSNWRTIGVPENRCPEVEAITGFSRESLRPDVDWIKYDRPCQKCGSRTHANRVGKAIRKRKQVLEAKHEPS